MGYLSALGMAKANGVNESTIGWHFSYNCIPAVPNKMIPFALKAIGYANKGMYKTQIKLPEGVSYHGKRMVPVYKVIESLHLDVFIQQEEE